MLSRESLHDQVVRHLAYKILAEGLTILPNEADLGKEFKVSRSILRESIKVLAAKGLVEVSPTGTRVRPRQRWNLLDEKLIGWITEKGSHDHFFADFYELRKAFEPKVAEVAALRATPEDLRQIQTAWEALRDAKTRDSYVAADLEFHHAVLIASHNELFYQVGTLNKIFLRATFSTTIGFPEAMFTSSAKLHREILKALVRGDAAGARKSMLQVVEASAGQIRQILQRRAERPPQKPKTTQKKKRSG